MVIDPKDPRVLPMTVLVALQRTILKAQQNVDGSARLGRYGWSKTALEREIEKDVKRVLDKRSNLDSIGADGD